MAKKNMKFGKDFIIAVSLQHFFSNVMPKVSLIAYNRNLNTNYDDLNEKTSNFLNNNIEIPLQFKTILNDNVHCINIGYCFITLMSYFDYIYKSCYKQPEFNIVKNNVKLRNINDNKNMYLSNISSEDLTLNFEKFFDTFDEYFSRYYFNFSDENKRIYFDLIQFFYFNINYDLTYDDYINQYFIFKF